MALIQVLDALGGEGARGPEKKAGKQSQKTMALFRRNL